MTRKKKEKGVHLQGGNAVGAVPFLWHAVSLLVLLICTVAAYSSSLNGTWALDDIVANRPVSINDIRDLVGFRQVAYFTFLVNQRLAPFDPLSFRLFNVGLHVLNAVLVYFLAFRTVKLYFRRTGGQSGTTVGASPGLQSKAAYHGALLCGAVFALHPININAVAYIVQRMAALSTFFVLLSLIFYMAAALSPHRLRAGAFWLLSASCVALGVLSKENAVMAIPLILLYDFVFIRPLQGGAFATRALVLCGTGVLGIGTILYALGAHGALFDIARLLVNLSQPLERQGWMATDVYWTPLEHLLSSFRAIGRYLSLIVAPLPQLLVFDWWGFPVSKGLVTPLSTLFSICFVTGLIAFSLWKMPKLPFLCFGILWYFLAVSLESSLALGADLYFEHRNYLPVTGLFLGSACQLALFLTRTVATRTIWMAIATVSIILGSLTFARNTVWRDSITLWTDTLQKVPSNLRAMMSLGNAYFKEMEFSKAEGFYKEALKISTRDRRVSYLDDAAYTLGMMYLFRGDLKEAKALADALESSVISYRSRILKGFYRALGKDPRGALEEYAAVIGETRGIDTVVVYTLMGDAYRDLGDPGRAIEQYRQALTHDPGFSAAYYGSGVAYMAMRDSGRAYEFFGKALAADPDNPLALADMADLLLIRKEYDRALEYARKALSKSPPFYQPYLSMGNVLTVGGRDDEADRYYRQAVAKGMADYMVPFSKARAYYMRGDQRKMEISIEEVRRHKDLPDSIRRIVEGKPQK